MGISQSVESKQSEIDRDIDRIVEAERNGEPFNNGKTRNVNVPKNTHYEYRFGGGDVPEITVYLERYDPGQGVEVMLWVHKDWFDEDTSNRPSIDDVDEVSEFSETVLSLVAECLDTSNQPLMEFHQNASPWVVFSADFRL